MTNHEKGPTPTNNNHDEAERPKTAAVYARAASGDVETARIAINRQQQACAASASRLGIQVVAGFVDAGIGGATLERPGLRHLIGWLDDERDRGRSVDYLAVTSVDRLARRYEELSRVYRMLGERGLRLLIAEDDHVVSVLPIHPSQRGNGGPDGAV